MPREVTSVFSAVTPPKRLRGGAPGTRREERRPEHEPDCSVEKSTLSDVTHTKREGSVGTPASLKLSSTPEGHRQEAATVSGHTESQITEENTGFLPEDLGVS